MHSVRLPFPSQQHKDLASAKHVMSCSGVETKGRELKHSPVGAALRLLDSPIALFFLVWGQGGKTARGLGAAQKREGAVYLGSMYTATWKTLEVGAQTFNLFLVLC